jgi:hypothetical protein
MLGGSSSNGKPIADAARIYRPSLEPSGSASGIKSDRIHNPMARHKNHSRSVHFFLEAQAFELLKAEASRLCCRPGRLLSKLVLERALSFHTKPVMVHDPHS